MTHILCLELSDPPKELRESLTTQRRQKSLFGVSRRYRESLSVRHAVPYVTADAHRARGSYRT